MRRVIRHMHDVRAIHVRQNSVRCHPELLVAKWLRLSATVRVRAIGTWNGLLSFLFSFFFSFEPNRTPNKKKTVTGVQVVTTSQVQSIGCRWQAIRAQTLTKRKVMGMKGVVSKGERQRVK